MVVILFVSLFSAPLFAQGGVNATETGFRDEVARLRSITQAPEDLSELIQIDNWIDAASQANAQGDRDRVRLLYQRIRFALDMVSAMSATHQLEKAINSQQSLVTDLQKKIDAIQKEISDLEQQKQSVQQEIDTMSNQQ